MSCDVFISYSTKDKKVVEQICSALESAGITCWMAHRDIPKTAIWADEIPIAIDNCKLFVLVFTSNANASKFVFKEVTYADDINKPILNFRIETFTPAPKFRLYLNTMQALEASTPPLEPFLPELIAVVRSLLPGAPAQPTPAPRIAPITQQTSPPPQGEGGRGLVPSAGATRLREKDGMVEVYVPAGEFTMGSNDGADVEKPPHKVILDGFWIDQTPVTNAMFAQFVATNPGFRTQAEKKGSGFIYDSSKKEWNLVNGADWRHPRGARSNLDGLENHPVVLVSWEDAKAYCGWAGARLPTEAQWEKAARGTDGRKYPWGNPEPDATLANFNLNVGTTTPVGSYPAGASPYGALDMAGNVWEWCADWYGEDYYAKSPPKNPQGPTSGEYRVVRGGSWYGVGWSLRAAFRGWSDPDYRVDLRGFRCCR